MHRADKRPITVRQLLQHTSGLPAVVRKGAKKIQTAAILGRIGRARLRSAPGARVRYSDVGFIVLGKLVEAVSGSDKCNARTCPIGSLEGGGSTEEV